MTTLTSGWFAGFLLLILLFILALNKFFKNNGGEKPVIPDLTQEDLDEEK